MALVAKGGGRISTLKVIQSLNECRPEQHAVEKSLGTRWFSVILLLQSHRIIEYSELDWTHKDHPGSALSFFTQHSTNHMPESIVSPQTL